MKWIQISFKEFVKLQQSLKITRSGLLEASGSWIEWGKGKLRYETRPHVRADMDLMELYFKKVLSKRATGRK